MYNQRKNFTTIKERILQQYKEERKNNKMEKRAMHFKETECCDTLVLFMAFQRHLVDPYGNRASGQQLLMLLGFYSKCVIQARGKKPLRMKDQV